MGKIVRNTNGYSLFFVRPGMGRDAHRSAMRLMEMREVKEVLITEGECGFVVKTDPISDNIVRLGKLITRIVGGDASIATCHCQYRK